MGSWQVQGILGYKMRSSKEKGGGQLLEGLSIYSVLELGDLRVTSQGQPSARVTSPAAIKMPRVHPHMPADVEDPLCGPPTSPTPREHQNKQRGHAESIPSPVPSFLTKNEIISHMLVPF